MRKIPKSEDVILALKKMAFGKANDAVKLIFAEEGGAAAVDGLDLTLLSEVKRGSNGTIEVKLINRLEAAALLAKLLGAGSNGNKAHCHTQLVHHAADGALLLFGKEHRGADTKKRRGARQTVEPHR